MLWDVFIQWHGAVLQQSNHECPSGQLFTIMNTQMRRHWWWRAAAGSVLLLGFFRTTEWSWSAARPSEDSTSSRGCEYPASPSSRLVKKPCIIYEAIMNKRFTNKTWRFVHDCFICRCHTVLCIWMEWMRKYFLWLLQIIIHIWIQSMKTHPGS